MSKILLKTTMSCCLIFTVLLQAQEAENLIANGSFKDVGAEGLPLHWQLSGDVLRSQILAQQGPGKTDAFRLETAGKKVITMSQEIAAAPNTLYVLELNVNATDSVTVMAGARRMAYTLDNAWQQMTDFVRTGPNGKLPLTIRLGGRHNQHNRFQLSQISLHKAPPVQVGQRRRYGETKLISGNAADAYIIYPREPALYRALAERVQQAVRQRSGVTIELVDDVAATEPEAPVLREEFRNRHLILLGRLGLNRGLWISYNRFLSAADGYYPGGDGFVVRTAANVLRNGKNHIIIGSSNEAGAEKGVEQFISLLDSAAGDAGELTLPWLLEAELGGECLETFAADNKMWNEDPFNSALPELEAGYKTVIRWYMNAMAYYWSGWDSYRQRTVEYFDTVLEDSAYTHHYIAEFLVRTYDMLDDSDVFTAEQILAGDKLIVKNFCDFLVGPDLNWMTLFNEPYENISLMNRHSIAPWMADLTMADFLYEYLNIDADLEKIVSYRRAEKHPFFEHLVSERWQPSLPRSLGASHFEEIVAVFFRYALHHEEYQFFNSGNARRALGLIDMIPGSSAYRDDHLIEGILAHYYQDGRYLWLLENTPAVAANRLFQRRYVCGVRRYRPGDELTPQDTASLGGVAMPELMPQDELFWKHSNYPLHRNPEVEPAAGAEAIVFRSGFDTDDDFLLLGTYGKFTGAIRELWSGGSRLLMMSSYSTFGPGAESYFDYNALSVIRTDKWGAEAKPYAGAARRDWMANLKQSGGAAITIDPFMDTRWRREVIWVQPRLFVVRDRVEALEDGTYSMSLGWRPQGTPSWDGQTWTGAVGGMQFRVTPLSNDFEVEQNVVEYNEGRAERPVFRCNLFADLQKGESREVVTVLQVVAESDHAYVPRRLSTDHLLLEPAQQETEPIALVWGPVNEHGLQSDARLLVLRPQRVDVLEGRECRIAERTLLDANRMISAKLDWSRNEVLINEGADGLHEAKLPEQDVSLAGSYWLKVDTASEQQPGVVAATSKPQAGFELKNEADAWDEVWSYGGLKQPARVTPQKHLGAGVFDFGREIEIAEIRAIMTTRHYHPAAIPETLQFAPATDTGVPAADSELWQPAPGKPAWRPGLATGNYGEAVPQAESYQIIRPHDFRARYVRGTAGEGTGTVFYEAARQRAATPLRLEVTDMNGDERSEILAKPYVWPKFIRSERHTSDTRLALLDEQGGEILNYQSDVNMHDVKLLENSSDGKLRTFVLTSDAQLRIFNPDGSLYRQDDLYGMHQNFHATEGRSNTRHPAGGYTMPYSFGLWRPDNNGSARTVIARYGAFSFIDAAGQFEGISMAGGYVLPEMLPYGVDFNGDGVQQQLCIGKGAILTVGGDATPIVTQPGGHLFYPQVYQWQRDREPGSTGHTVDGVPVYVFSALPFQRENHTPYVLSARESYLGIYDVEKQNWIFSWVPALPLQQAVIVSADKNALAVIAATADGLLWRLIWQDDLQQPAGFEVKKISDWVVQMNADPAEPGAVYLACTRGLYRLDNFNKLTRLANGAWQDVKVVPGSSTAVIAVNADGDVKRLQKNARVSTLK